jgi:Trp operon repressor
MKRGQNQLENDSGEVDVASELMDIKRLLVLLLLKAGATQTELAKALNIGQATISRQYGMGKVKSLTVELMSGKGE